MVTAGLVLLMNFDFLIKNTIMSVYVIVFGLVTMFFSGVIALMELDLKKVVALSTLSQIGFSMLTLGIGLEFISYLHLLSHALFKRCLFIQVGYVIHCMFGQQDRRFCNNNYNVSFYVQLSILVTVFCLCGMIFFSGAVSKDYILSYFFVSNYNFILLLVFLVSVFITFVYSYRLLKSFFSMGVCGVVFYDGSYLVRVRSVILVLLSIVFL